MVKETTDEIFSGFDIQPSEVIIKNNKCPTKLELKNLRSDINNNLFKLTCTNEDWAPYKWAVVIIPKEQWIDFNIKKQNQEIKENTLEVLKAAAPDQATKDALTIDGVEATAVWELILLNKNSDEVQLPKYDKNPGRFKIDSAWTDKQINTGIFLGPISRFRNI